MHPNEQLLNKFYQSFQNRDYHSMNECYHPEATFQDPAFTLKGKQIKAMWHMLCAAGKDMKLEFRDIQADDKRGKAHWDVHYSVLIVRKINNSIDAEFKFKDGLIFEHKDSFDFQSWLTQAAGPLGVLIGGFPLLQLPLRKGVHLGLMAFIQTHPEYR